jgi:hypothetical protein
MVTSSPTKYDDVLLCTVVKYRRKGKGKVHEESTTTMYIPLLTELQDKKHGEKHGAVGMTLCQNVALRVIG